jgi:hypothetical protein
VIPEGAFRNAGKVVKAKFPDGGEPTLDPTKSFRPAFAAWLTARENPYFARAAANRLWAHFLGRGLVNPLDDFREDNPPSHPALLQLLADEFAGSAFDLKHLIRCICNSKAYQRTSRPLPENRNDKLLFSRTEAKLLTPEMLLDSLEVAMGGQIVPITPTPKAKTVLYVVGPREELLMMFATKEASEPAPEFRHGIVQALRLMNITSRAPIVDRLVGPGKSTERIIEELYLAALARRPSAEELKRSGAFVARKQDPKDGYAGLLWVLLNQSEFILNH